MRTVLSGFLLVVGTVVATLGFARTDPKEPGWRQKIQIHYPVAAAGLVLMLTAIALRYSGRVAPADRGRNDSDDPAAPPSTGIDIGAIRQALSAARDQIRTLEQEEGETAVPPAAIERIVTAHLMPIIERRHQILEQLGGRRFAELFGVIAEAERWLNRAWSAAVDGYPAEVNRSLANARRDLESALALVESWLVPGTR